MLQLLWLALALLIGGSVLIVIGLLSYLVRRWKEVVPPESAAARFQQQREHLEADFLRAATRSGKPRGLRWKHCDWANEVVLARDRKNGELTALVGVKIQFEAIEGSDMEGLPAVGTLRNASAVFAFDGRANWRPTGRAIFNLNPDEVLTRFKDQFQPLVR